MMALLKEEPTPYIAALEQRIVEGAARPWGVQLAAGFSRDNALASYARMVKRFGGMADEHDPIVSSTLLRSRGTRPFYQIRIGADTRTEANTLCGSIRKAGGACLVLRQLPAPRRRAEQRLAVSRRSIRDQPSSGRLADAVRAVRPPSITRNCGGGRRRAAIAIAFESDPAGATLHVAALELISDAPAVRRLKRPDTQIDNLVGSRVHRRVLPTNKRARRTGVPRRAMNLWYRMGG